MGQSGRVSAPAALFLGHPLCTNTVRTMLGAGSECPVSHHHICYFSLVASITITNTFLCVFAPQDCGLCEVRHYILLFVCTVYQIPTTTPGGVYLLNLITNSALWERTWLWKLCTVENPHQDVGSWAWMRIKCWCGNTFDLLPLATCIPRPTLPSCHLPFPYPFLHLILPTVLCVSLVPVPYMCSIWYTTRWLVNLFPPLWTFLRQSFSV